MSPMAYTALGRNPLNKRVSKPSDAFHQTAAQQIVGRERRERLSQLAWCGEGCFDSRRRVNSTVMLLHPINAMRILFLLVVSLFLPSLVHGQDQEMRLGNPITREQVLALDRQRPTVLRAIVPAYPPIAASKRISGTVLIDVDIDPKGNIIEARPIIGGKYLRDSARKAALRWQ